MNRILFVTQTEKIPTKSQKWHQSIKLIKIFNTSSKEIKLRISQWRLKQKSISCESCLFSAYIPLYHFDLWLYLPSRYLSLTIAWQTERILIISTHRMVLIIDVFFVCYRTLIRSSLMMRYSRQASCVYTSVSSRISSRSISCCFL